MNSLNARSAKRLAVLVAVLGMFASVVHAQTNLTNGVAVTGISGTAGSEKFYKIEVPSGQDELVISTSGGTGDVDLYVRRGSLPTTTSYDYRPYKIGNEETVTVSNPVAGTWYIMLKGYNAYSGVTLLAEYSAATAITPLTNSVPVTGLSGAAAGELYFSIVVPASQTKLEISISGGSGDADLYVKRGALPTTSSYDYRPYLSGNNESVSINNPAAATWYIMIRGFNAFSGVTLLASYGGGGVGTLLENGVPVTGVAGAQASETQFRIEVPSGQTSLTIAMTGGTGDADLYVKFGASPTTSSFDYRPFLAGNEETVTVPTPTGGTWYIMIRGYSAYTGVTLTASYGDVIMLQDGVPRTGLSGGLNSMTYYRIDVPSGNDMILFSMSGGTGNADMYIKQGTKPTTSSWDYRPITSTNTESVSIGSTALSGTWYVMIKGTAAYSGVTLLADYSVSNVVTTLVNGVAVNGISGTQTLVKYYKIDVPSGQTKLEIQMSGGTGDADLYVRHGFLPTTADYDYRPYLTGNNESVTVNNPTAGTWYIMIRGREAFSGVTLLATYGGAIPDTVTELQNGVPVSGIAGASSSETFYKIVVPAGQASLVIFTTGGTGDVDLYVRLGAKPTTSLWDHRPYLIGNEETVTINTPSAGTYYIMLRGYSAYTGVTLKATYTPVADDVTELQNGVAVAGIAGTSGSEKFYKIVVPASQESLKIEMSGGTGDADLYVRRGSKPTLTSWDYRPYLIGNNETVEVTNPAAATWYIMLRGYNAYTGVTLKATYGVTFAGNDFTVDPDAVAWWRFETSKLGADTIATNILTNHGAVAKTTDKKEGDSSADLEASELDYLWIPDANLSSDFPLRAAGTSKSISVAYWMKLESLPAFGSTMDPFSKADVTNGKISITHMVNLLGQIGFLAGWKNGQNWNNYWTTTTEKVAVGKWYHVVITYNDNNQNYRINVWDAEAAALVANTTGTTLYHMSVTDADVCVGARSDAVDRRYFDGLLDEMVVFKDVLTEAEIAKIRAGTYGKP
ncbi:MAG: pre-peptidase C-terminal domain-containing protein [Phycisphaerales bacterium]